MAITLDYDDPTIFAICSGKCTQHRPGKKVGDYFAKAYTPRRWKRGPKCDNCSADMRFLYEVSRD
jgi:hypothetical protein